MYFQVLLASLLTRAESESNETGCFEFPKRFKNFAYFNVSDLDLSERCVSISRTVEWLTFTVTVWTDLIIIWQRFDKDLSKESFITCKCRILSKIYYTVQTLAVESLKHAKNVCVHIIKPPCSVLYSFCCVWSNIQIINYLKYKYNIFTN